MFELEGFQHRVYEIKCGDIIWVNETGVQDLFNMPIKRLPLGKRMEPSFICIEKTKRRHWWQFWKPKYVAAKFMYVEKEKLQDD